MQMHEAWGARLKSVVARLKAGGEDLRQSEYQRRAVADGLAQHLGDLEWPSSVLEGAQSRPGGREHVFHLALDCTARMLAQIDDAVDARLAAGIPCDRASLVRGCIVAQIEADEAALSRPQRRASLRTARRSARATSRRRADEACAASSSVRGRRRDANLAQSVEQRFRKP